MLYGEDTWPGLEGQHCGQKLLGYDNKILKKNIHKLYTYFKDNS